MRTIPPPLPAVEVDARFVCPASDLRTLLDGAGALMRTETQGGRGPVVAYYFVQRLTAAGRLLGYRLVKVGPEGETEEHEIDLTFGGWPCASCSCRDYQHRAGRRPDRRCKHVASVDQSLMRAGLKLAVE